MPNTGLGVKFGLEDLTLICNKSLLKSNLEDYESLSLGFAKIEVEFSLWVEYKLESKFFKGDNIKSWVWSEFWTQRLDIDLQ